MSDEKPVILLVEDDKILHNTAAEILQKEFMASSSFTGHSAMAYLKNHTPDAVLLDIRLPDIDGYGILEYIRSCERLNDTAVIMFTNFSELLDKNKADEMGADDYYVKVELDLQDLPKIIHTAINKRRGGQAGGLLGKIFS